MDPDSIDPLPAFILAISDFPAAVVLSGVIMLLLLCCSALISASEVAYFGMKLSEREQLEKRTGSKAQNARKLMGQPKWLLATILIANNTVNVCFIILSSVVIDDVFRGANLGKTGLLLVQIFGVTGILLLFGEVIPKVFATRNALPIVLFMSAPLMVLKTLFSPLSRILMGMTTLIDRRVSNKSPIISVNQLEQALELTTSENNQDHNEQRILEGIVRFGNTDVKQIMTPRVDVVALSADTGFKEVVKVIIDSGYSRIPVYGNTLDDVKGIIYAKDLIPHVDESDDFNWHRFLRDAFFVPETKKNDDLLREFQKRKMHLAVVVDEYGGSQGIVTLEDVLEEIVGDITDEFDETHVPYNQVDEYNYVFEAKTPLVDLYRVLNIENTEEFDNARGDSETLGGFLMEVSGKIMRKNEKVTFGDYIFTVEASDKRRVKQVRITVNEFNKLS